MNRRRKSRGVAAVEFALIVLPFSVVMFGLIDYGWYFYVDLASTNAVREGARAATTISGPCTSNPNTPTPSQAGTAAVNAYLAGILPTGYTTTITPTCDDHTLPSGDPIYTFSLQVTFPPLTGSTLVPLPGTPGHVQVNTSATMRGTFQ